MIFKTHPKNIADLTDAVNAFGSAWIHGDGNIYDTDDDSRKSNTRKDFSNPKQEEATYRKLYKKGDPIPETVEELNEALMAAKNADILASRQSQQVSNIKTIPKREVRVIEKTEEDNAGQQGQSIPETKTNGKKIRIITPQQPDADPAE